MTGVFVNQRLNKILFNITQTITVAALEYIGHLQKSIVTGFYIRLLEVNFMFRKTNWMCFSSEQTNGMDTTKTNNTLFSHLIFNILATITWRFSENLSIKWQVFHSWPLFCWGIFNIFALFYFSQKRIPSFQNWFLSEFFWRIQSICTLKSNIK